MARINIDGEQNVEVSIKIPSQKTPKEQLEIMEAYTRAHMESGGLDKAQRELACLRTIYPALFRTIEEGGFNRRPPGFPSHRLWMCDQYRWSWALLCVPQAQGV